MPNPLLQIDSLTKSFGDLLLFKDISFGIAEGDKIGLIAANGSGKTTLLNIISGKEPYDSGRVVFRNDIRVDYLEQSPEFNPDLTVLEACFSADNDIVRLIARYEDIIASDNQNELSHILAEMDLHNAWDYEQRIKNILSQLKIYDFHQKIGELSGGQVKRVALANVLISEPELIILDEPTNHLDLDMVEWLEEYLSRNNISLLMVTHDRYFLDRVCSQIIEIDDKQVYSYKGNYSYYLEKRDERILAQNSEVSRAQNLMRKELDWMRRQPQARGTKSKSRIDAFYTLEEKAKKQREEKSIQLNSINSYIGKKIFEAKHVTKSFGDIKITDDFNYNFTRYEKMGIVGNNGTGKSTFIKMLLGVEKPDEGYFEIGETVNFGYYSQDGLQFDDQKKVIDVVTDIAEVIDQGDGKKLTASQFLQHFMFPPEKQHNYVYKLSGGEKRRLYLCTVLITNPNFLVLDEPTNDLDIITLNILEEYLASFKGCLIVISHDRYFMDKVVDHLLVFHGNAKIQNYPGNYTQYREWKAEEDKRQSEVAKIVKTESEPADSRKKEEVKTKLTFKEKREFESLEKEIEELEEEKKLLSEEISSGKLNTDELLSKSNRLTELLNLIDEKTMRWLELSEI
ncbi:MAG: ABC-F family ATP-binding cassette domain-containing protein [Fermentimonas caenicola]|jgi:ATP-binding cassette subfamily F protein uup|uniref:ABC-F family ATP-binding cassette domain-containing protein n=1 Tax=Lascolabacillus sp. TaxID=1924068 RepID=UPI001201DD70|nr:ABC-F family ATP-binding cassette domain-containing protein [Lascolabacillus sp.]MDD3657935.1 ABC-F family ATP-binding cassette domain-containing protein [Lascolabacillus sp.]MDD4757683.1 ABC-F family ATP-binding cassette domain-containing protein [Lascolabacillus sp.]TAH62396.1 MAG: ABC transporter ATP-binding protein [Fermentimonas caenicola]